MKASVNTPLVSGLSEDPELFQSERFNALISEAGSVAKAIKRQVAAGDELLERRFRARKNIKLIIRRRAWLIDHLLEQLWLQFFPATLDGIALVAVGGYGRAELHPGSDIDLMILLENNTLAERYHDQLSTFVTQLWDTGLDIGHSVRTLHDCQQLAQEDITIATNLMESRLVAGSAALAANLQTLMASDELCTAADYSAAKLAEQQARHDKFSNTEYNLEPDIKNAPGGLRDIHTIGWIAKRYFGANRLSELVDREFLTREEYSTLNAAQHFLWRLRFALHLITGRSENRLLFDHQKAVARVLGYRDSNHNLAVEKMMKRYYRTAQAVSLLNDVLLQHFNEVVLHSGEDERITPINSRFQLRDGYIETVHDRVFEHTPSALLEIFMILAQNEDIPGIRASTIRLLRDHRHLIDQRFRDDLRNISFFMELLRSPNKIYTQFYRMKRYGILGNYIPAFGQVVGQMQFDLFHIYTVDAHTLHVLRNMRMFRHPEVKEEFPIAHMIVQRLPKVELLYLAGMFHDLAKGRGGDHSELGARDAYDFCIHHRLSNRDAKLVAWLVENHLLMSLTAQKEDTSDPDVIHKFATRVGDQTRLDYLHALTVADICATNPKLWNGWRSSLLRQLYANTRRALRRGLENPADRQEWIAETREQALQLLDAEGFDDRSVQAVWRTLGEDYFLRESAADVARHTQAIIHHTDLSQPLVTIGSTDERGYLGATEIFIYTQDAPNLFAVTVAALNQLNLTIVDAKIMTSTVGFSLDTFTVLDQHGEDLSNDFGRVQQIRDKLSHLLKDPSRYPDIVKQRLPRVLKSFNIKTDVTISNDIEHEHTVLELVALDQPGLLADLGRIFLDNGILVKSAKIATLGERVEDVFCITDLNGQMINDSSVCRDLKTDIQQEFDRAET